MKPRQKRRSYESGHIFHAHKKIFVFGSNEMCKIHIETYQSHQQQQPQQQ